MPLCQRQNEDDDGEARRRGLLTYFVHPSWLGFIIPPSLFLLFFFLFSFSFSFFFFPCAIFTWASSSFLSSLCRAPLSNRSLFLDLDGRCLSLERSVARHPASVLDESLSYLLLRNVHSFACSPLCYNTSHNQ